MCAWCFVCFYPFRFLPLFLYYDYRHRIATGVGGVLANANTAWIPKLYLVTVLNLSTELLILWARCTYWPDNAMLLASERVYWLSPPLETRGLSGIPTWRMFRWPDRLEQDSASIYVRRILNILNRSWEIMRMSSMIMPLSMRLWSVIRSGISFEPISVQSLQNMLNIGQNGMIRAILQ